MSELRHRRAKVNGIELDITEAGSGEPVICVHGFPESAHSWRHQLPVLADAGYHAIAPDMRGYAGSSKPKDVSDYGITPLTDDLLALLDETGHEKAIFIGHDWGALITWDLCRLHPGRVKGLINVSVPFVDWPAKPLDLFRMTYGDNFFYIVYFQDVGVVEAELDHQAARFQKAILWAASGDGWSDEQRTFKAAGTAMLDTMREPPAQLPEWCSAGDLSIYARQFEKSGYFGPCSYYRNLDPNYELVKNYPVSLMTMPIWFIGGSKDMVIARDLNGLARMADQLPNYRGHTVIEGAGHWTQQERPQEFNDAMLRALNELRTIEGT